MYVSICYDVPFSWNDSNFYCMFYGVNNNTSNKIECMYVYMKGSQYVCMCVCVRVHVGMCLVASMFNTSHRFLLDSMVMQILTSLPSVPWFPQSIQELDQFADHILCFGSDLASYLPVSCYLCVWQLTVQHRSE